MPYLRDTLYTSVIHPYYHAQMLTAKLKEVPMGQAFALGKIAARFSIVRAGGIVEYLIQAKSLFGKIAANSFQSHAFATQGGALLPKLLFGDIHMTNDGDEVASV